MYRLPHLARQSDSSDRYSLRDMTGAIIFSVAQGPLANGQSTIASPVSIGVPLRHYWERIAVNLTTKSPTPWL